METKGDHEHTLSDTFLQIVECVNLNIGLIAKDELVKSSINTLCKNILLYEVIIIQ